MEVTFDSSSHGIWQKLEILAFSKIKEDDRQNVFCLSNDTFAKYHG